MGLNYNLPHVSKKITALEVENRNLREGAGTSNDRVQVLEQKVAAIQPCLCALESNEPAGSQTKVATEKTSKEEEVKQGSTSASTSQQNISSPGQTSQSKAPLVKEKPPFRFETRSHFSQFRKEPGVTHLRFC